MLSFIEDYTAAKEEAAGEAEKEMDARQTAMERYFHSLVNSGNEKRINFLKSVLKAGVKRSIDLDYEIAKNTMEFSEQLQNDEIEGLELLGAVPKEREKAIPSITSMYSPLHKEKRTIQTAISNIESGWQSMTEAEGEPLELFEELEIWKQQCNIEAVQAHPGLQQLKKEGITTDYGQQFNSVIKAKTSLTKDGRYELNDESDEIAVEKVPPVYSHIKKLTDKELDNLNEELQGDLAFFTEYEKAGDEWAGKAKDLLTELENAATPEEKETDAYKSLKELLTAGANTGEEMWVNLPGLIAGRTFFSYSPEGIDTVCTVLAEKGEQYGGDIGKRISDAAKDAKNTITGMISDRPGLKERCKDDEAFSSKYVKDDLLRVQKEQQLRLAQKDSIGMQDMGNLKTKMRGINADYRDLSVFEGKVSKARFAVTHFTGLMNDDNTARGLAQKDRGKHSEYMNLADLTKEIADLDPGKYRPSEILEKMRQAKEAADTYVKTHEGLGNITKGWRSQGRERIRIAKELSNSLKEQIDKLEPDVQTMEKKLPEGKTIDGRMADLEAGRKAVRNEMAEKRKVLYAPLNERIDRRVRSYEEQNKQHEAEHTAGKQGTILQNAALVAGDSIKALEKYCDRDHSIPFTPEEKKAIPVHIARITAYDRNMFDAGKNLSKEGYMNFINGLAESDAFKASIDQVLDGVTPEKLTGFCLHPEQSAKLSSVFIDKMNARNAKNDAQAPGKLEEKKNDGPAKDQGNPLVM